MTRAVVLAVTSLVGQRLVQAAGGGSPQGLPKTVPTFVMEAARATVADLTYALAEARVPAGFVVPEGDFDDDAAWGSGVEWRLRSSQETGAVSLASVVAAFRERHPAYDVEDRGGVLTIHATATGPLSPLEQPSGRRLRVRDEYLSTAFGEAERLVDPRIPRVGGIVGSILGNPDDPPRELSEERVSLDLPNATLLGALNEIVRAAPGTVWVLSHHRSDRDYYTLANRMPPGLLSRSDNHLYLEPKK